MRMARKAGAFFCQIYWRLFLRRQFQRGFWIFHNFGFQFRQESEDTPG